MSNTWSFDFSCKFIQNIFLVWFNILTIKNDLNDLSTFHHDCVELTLRQLDITI